jgi:hypothetical protein
VSFLWPHVHPLRHRQPNFRYSESRTPEIGKNAPSDVQDAWHQSFEQARDYYTAEKAPSPENLAKNTAWKTVKLFWSEPRKGHFRARNPNEPVRAGTYRGDPLYIGDEEDIPVPGPTAALCKLIELTWIAADGTLQVQRFSAPGLPDVLWNRKTKILYMFPDVELGEGVCQIPKQGSSRVPRILRNLMSPLRADDDVFVGLDDQVKMYKLWAKRGPTCRHKITIPEDPIVAFGAADTIVYRSDKWQKEPNPDPDKMGSQEYLHQFGLDVAIEETPSRRDRRPASIVVRGGKLDVLEGGIAY